MITMFAFMWILALTYTRSYTFHSGGDQWSFNRGSIRESDYGIKEDLKSLNKINGLLTRAIKVASNMRSKSVNVSESMLENGPKKNLALKFKTKLIMLAEKSTAYEYLAQPVSSYSVLDSNFVSRLSEKTFRFNLPLREITAIAPFQISADVFTDVEVSTKPEKGIIQIESSAIYFKPVGSNQFSEETSLPDWILWGGGTVGGDSVNGQSLITNDRIQNPLYNSSTKENSTFSDSISDDDLNITLHSEQNTPLKKSSVQASLRITMSWTPQIDTFYNKNLIIEDNAKRSSFRILQKLRRPWTRLFPPNTSSMSSLASPSASSSAHSFSSGKSTNVSSVIPIYFVGSNHGTTGSTINQDPSYRNKRTTKHDQKLLVRQTKVNFQIESQRNIAPRLLTFDEEVAALALDSSLSSSNTTTYSVPSTTPGANMDVSLGVLDQDYDDSDYDENQFIPKISSCNKDVSKYESIAANHQADFSAASAAQGGTSRCSDPSPSAIPPPASVDRVTALTCATARTDSSTEVGGDLVSAEGTDTAVIDSESSLSRPDPLQVCAEIEVDVEIFVPLPSSLANILTLAPIRLLLQRAGSLITSAILRTVGPSLALSLQKHYMEWSEGRLEGGTNIDGY